MKQRTVYAEESLQHEKQGEELRARYPDLIWIADYQGFRGASVSGEKRSIVFAKKRGAWLKPFQYYQHASSYECYSLNIAEGCSFDCVYCYLQTYLNHAALVIFLDDPSLDEELREVQKDGKRLWISSGLLTDSLIVEPVAPMAARISRSIGVGSVLELRTKSADVGSLMDPEIMRDRVVVSWSLSPQSIADHYEFGAAGTAERIAAAEKAIAMGYRVGFHFDPIFLYEGWKDEYGALISRVNRMPVDRIAFLSVGLFRYMPELGAEIRRRWSSHPVLTGEFFPEADGKYHYFRSMRKDAHGWLGKELRDWIDRVPVFWSMEPDSRLV